MTVRLIKHEAVPKCGSYEVRFSDGRPSAYFYFEDLPGRRLRSEQQMTRAEALQAAKVSPERSKISLIVLRLCRRVLQADCWEMRKNAGNVD